MTTKKGSRVVQFDACTPPTTSFSAAGVNITVDDYGSIFYFNNPASDLPACLDMIYMRTSTTEIGPNATEYSSSPDRLLILSAPPVIDSSTSQFTSNITLMLGDYWHQAVVSDFIQCSDFSLCYRYLNSSSIATCDNATKRLQALINLSQFNDTELDVYFGPSFCDPSQPPPVNRFAVPSTTVKITRKSITPQHSPSSTPVTPNTPSGSAANPGGFPLAYVAFIVVGGCLLLVGVIVGIYLYYRYNKRRVAKHELKQPLIDAQGEVMTDVLTNLLLECSIPVVDPSDIDIQSTIGSGATGTVLLGKVRVMSFGPLGIQYAELKDCCPLILL